MSGGKSGVLPIDDFTQKAMIVLSILIICLVTLAVVQLFFNIKDYQEKRSDEFEEASQMAQVDYLIELLDRQDKILQANMKGGRIPAEQMEKEVEQYLALHREFSDELEGLLLNSEVLTRKFDEELASRGRKGVKSSYYSSMLQDYGFGGERLAGSGR